MENDIVKINSVENRVIEVRGEKVLLDSDVAALSSTDNQYSQKTLMQKSGDIMADILGEDLQTTDTETSMELNLAVLKFKHTIKRKAE